MSDTQALILSTIQQLRDDFAEERRMAHESRAVIHRRLDEQAADIGELKTAVTVSAHIDAQVREELKGLGKKVEANHDEVMPTVEEWQRIKKLGIGIGGMLAIGGMSIAGTIAYFGEAFWNWLRHFLKVG